jgi:uncharacterized membrane protein (UPF0127 family)
MKSSSWSLPDLWNRLAGQREAADIRLRVLNVTRQTLLADALEVADSGAKRNKGLLGRKGLSAGEGLWIVPCESVHTFGMQFSIDLVYLNRELRIKKTRSNVPPWRISACLSAHSILELPAGTIHDTQTSPGDVLEITATPTSADTVHDNAIDS